MSSLALDIFRRLIDQVQEVESAALRAISDGYPDAAPILRRSGFVLAVAAFDTYFHERAVELLVRAVAQGAPHDARVVKYLGNVGLGDATGKSGPSHIRMSLSYKTLVSPKAIDGMLGAAGVDAIACWQQCAFALGTRPDRLRLQTELVYDRRNQIAHEGDWDFVQIDFRLMGQANLADCVNHVTSLAEQADVYI